MFTLIHTQINSQECTAHTWHPCPLMYAFVSAHCLPTSNIRGGVTAPVGAIYRSNSKEFLHISDTDLKRLPPSYWHSFFTQGVQNLMSLSAVVTTWAVLSLTLFHFVCSTQWSRFTINQLFHFELIKTLKLSKFIATTSTGATWFKFKHICHCHM